MRKFLDHLFISNIGLIKQKPFSRYCPFKGALAWNICRWAFTIHAFMGYRWLRNYTKQFKNILVGPDIRKFSVHEPLYSVRVSSMFLKDIIIPYP